MSNNKLYLLAGVQTVPQQYIGEIKSTFLEHKVYVSNKILTNTDKGYRNPFQSGGHSVREG